MRIKILYNFFRLDSIHPLAMLLYELASRKVKNDDIEIINIDDEFSNRNEVFMSDSPDISDWAIYQECVNSIVFNKRIFDADLFIGFELPPSLCKELSYNNKKYINFFVAPIRFMSDLVWYVTTNSIEIYKVLHIYRFNKKNIDKYVDDIHYMCIKQRLFQDKHLKNNTAIIIGQDLNDSSVILNGNFKNLNDYKDEIIRLTKDCDDIIIVKHPCVNNIMPLRQLLKSLGRGKISNFNTYALLCSDKVSKVITISSSVGVEAKYFDKEVHFLLGEAHRNGGSMVCKDDYKEMIGEAVYTSDFYDNIINVCKTPSNNFSMVKILNMYIKSDIYKDNDNEGLLNYDTADICKENHLRNIIGNSWAYNNAGFIVKNPFLVGYFNDCERIKLAEDGIKVMDNISKFVDFSNFDDCIYYESNGLSEIDNNGRWTQENNVTIKLLVPDKSYNRIKLKVYPYLNEYITKQIIKISIEENKLLKEVHIYEKEVAEIVLNIEDVYGEIAILKMYIPYAKSPAELGLSTDVRKLGLLIMNIEFIQQ